MDDESSPELDKGTAAHETVARDLGGIVQDESQAKVFESVKKGTALTKIMKFEEFRREHEREIRAKLDFHPSEK